MENQAVNTTGNEKGCGYWCEVFGFTTFTTAIFGMGLAVF